MMMQHLGNAALAATTVDGCPKPELSSGSLLALNLT